MSVRPMISAGRPGRGRAWGLGLLLALVSLSAACAMGPDYERPQMPPAPAAYKEMQGWKVAQPQAEAPKGPWWGVYGDPELDRLEAEAAQANQSIVVAEASLRQARALASQAGAALWPTLGAEGSYTRGQRSSNTSSGGAVGNEPYTDHLMSLNLSWELDLWGRVRRNREAYEASAQASAADLESARLSVQAELAQDYFLLRNQDATRQTLDTTVASYQTYLDLTKRRFASGVVSQADVAQAETQLKNAQAQALDLGVQRAQLEHAIALLLGRNPSEFSLPPASLGAAPPVSPVGLPSELLERRPDVAAAERRVAAANAQIGVATAAFFPTVSLGASGGYESSAFSNWVSWPSRLWSVGPSVAQTIFDGGLRRAQLEGARASYEGTVATYRQTVLTAFKEVEDNLASLRILEQEAKVQAEAVAAARRSLEITSNQYKAGTVAYLSVIVAQASLLSQEKSALDVQGRRFTASVLLIKALGGGWQAKELEAQAAP